MLSKLTVRNYALIDELSIEFDKGLTIITGETGAGKSILLGALGLLLGDRADSSALMDKTQKCIVEGTFGIKNYSLGNFFSESDLDYSDETTIRREVNADGKSRSFVNDTPVNVTTLRALSEKLVDVHSQHETLTLNDSSFQLSVIDAVAENEELLRKYRDAYSLYRKTLVKLSEVTALEAKSKTDLDYFRFQFDELEKAHLEDGEQEKLETELSTLENAETIKNGLSSSAFALNGSEENILLSIGTIKQALSQLSKFNPQIAALNERVNSSLIELKDIAAELESLNDDIAVDPKRMEIVQEKLDAIYRLEKKHNVATVAELIALRDSLSEKIASIGSLEEQIAKLAAETQMQLKKVKELAEKLSGKRSEAAPLLSKSVAGTLKQLGMPNAMLDVQLEILPEPRESGTDKATFLFSANKGSAPQPLNKVASGGELSRLMLSLKSLLAERTALPTIIFDEIDTGISGDVAAKTGSILEKLSRNLQVITITHLPQVASKGKSHLFVYKEESGKRTYTRIRRLNGEERVEEIAKMLSAGKPGDAAMRNAKELLDAK
ncbi:MAG TPA: DNA repair protein RecN [Bacteroidia bacterium]|nr:DNA repair protein RecN [Bacteroidia bacterium]